VPDRNRYGPLAESMAANRQGGGQGFFRTLFSAIGRGIRNTPIAHFARGDVVGGVNASPAGQVLTALRGGDPLGPNNSRRALNQGPPTVENQRFPRPTGMNAYGPVLNGYGGPVGDSGVPDVSWGGTDWNAAIQPQGLPWGDGPLTIATRYGHGAMSAADRGVNAGYNTGNMGYSGSTNPLLAANTVNGGIGGLQMNSPWKQSGVFFNDRQQEF